MRKWFILCVIAAAMLAAGNINTASMSDIYPHSAIVVNIDIGTDTVIIRDQSGRTWQFSGVEDWMIGDICACIMHSNGTQSVLDDTVLKARYAGFYPVFY